MLGAKLHGVKLTHSELNYEGSCAIDLNLLNAAGILPFEQIHIWNVTNGARFTTYAIEAPLGSGIISLNGGAARQGQVGDKLVIAAFIYLSAEEVSKHKPKLIFVDANNQAKSTRDFVPPAQYL
jgi:aspartate 1-decarboxylase